MGQSKSKGQHYPPFLGYPPYGPPYPYHPQPVPPYGPGFNGPGFIPPGFGPQIAMPQPAVPWQAHPKKRKKNKEKSQSSTGHSAHHQHHQSAQNPNPATVNPQPPGHGLVDSLPPGFIPTSIAPHLQTTLAPVIPPPPPNINPASAAQNQQPPPLFTPGTAGGIPLTGFPSPQITTQPPPAVGQGSQRRAQTPFIPPFPQVDTAADDDARENSQSQRQNSSSHRRALSQPHRRTSSAQHPPHGYVQPSIDPSAYLPPLLPPNPLPPPPRDLYELSPYKTLLNLPQTMTLLTATTTGNGAVNPNVTVVRANTTAGIAGIGAGLNGRKKTKSKKGFFHFGSRSHDDGVPQQAQQPTLGNIQFVPVPMYQNRPGQNSNPTRTTGATITGPAVAPVPPEPTPPSPPAQRSIPESPPGGGDIQRSTTPHSHHTRSHSRNSHQSHPSQHHHQQSSTSSTAPVIPTQPHHRSSEIIEFDQQTHPEFLNHSPHRVLYANQIYPTATHLHEALKFIDHRPDFATRIRLCQSVQDVYPLSSSLQAWVRPDWGMVYLNKMEEVLWNKFRQHPDLRSALMGTGEGELVYADLNDVYWGSGNAIGESRGPGTNQLGKLLVKVRERLSVEGLP